jgi:predicted metal-dependent peptidase
VNNQHPFQYDRVRYARERLVLDQPFFGVLASLLHLTIDPSCDTAWTDGTSIGFSPKFVDTSTDDELLAVFCHEVLHCACGHPWRRDNREHKQWNVACDYAINPIVREAGMMLPAKALLDAQYSGHNAEWIFDRLPQQQQQQNNDPSDLGEVRDAPQSDPMDDKGNTIPRQSESEWKQAATQAENLAKGQGTLGAGTARTLDAASRQPADWRSLLRKYVQQAARADYSWRRPNYRHLARGMYLPSLHSVQCGPIAVAVDTSGSIDATLLGQFSREIDAIAAEVQPAHVDVIYCDATVNHTERFDRGDPIALHAHGGGGTDFRPAFEHADTLDEQPAVLIYLTDMAGTYPEQAPAYPVIWAAYGAYVDHYAAQVTFGDVVPCE